MLPPSWDRIDPPTPQLPTSSSHHWLQWGRLTDYDKNIVSSVSPSLHLVHLDWWLLFTVSSGGGVSFVPEDAARARAGKLLLEKVALCHCWTANYADSPVRSDGKFWGLIALL